MTRGLGVGLLLPALDEGSAGEAAVGPRGGRALPAGQPPAARPTEIPHIAGLHGAGVRRSLLVFGVLLVHSLPEGFAIGTAFASDTEGLALFVFLAIALQNIPEGTSVAIPMEGAGFGRYQQFWAAVRTSAPQPVGAVIAYLAVEQITGLLPTLLLLRRGRHAGAGGRRAPAPGARRRGVALKALAGVGGRRGTMLLLAALLGV